MFVDTGETASTVSLVTVTNPLLVTKTLVSNAYLTGMNNTNEACLSDINDTSELMPASTNPKITTNFAVVIVTSGECFISVVDTVRAPRTIVIVSGESKVEILTAH